MPHLMTGAIIQGNLGVLKMAADRQMAFAALRIMMLSLVTTANGFLSAPGCWRQVQLARRATGVLPDRTLSHPRSTGIDFQQRSVLSLRAAGDENDGNAPMQSSVKIPAAVAKEDLSSAANPVKNMAGQVCTMPACGQSAHTMLTSCAAYSSTDAVRAG